MARMTLFNSPLLLGFDEIERTLDRVAKMSSDGYPPYNIEQLDEDRIRITLAVAGFSEEDLTIQREDDQLIVIGRQASEDGEERIFLHRGIAARQFQRRFVLAEGIEIDGATLSNGLLDIDLRRPRPEARVEKIAINSGRKTKSARAPKALDVEDA
ncbi:MAG: Hsp20 family protein [Alphaproteobacteria bacterium]|nr:Hsp20 family protein [Alphaproteobacteria bacterium]